MPMPNDPKANDTPLIRLVSSATDGSSTNTTEVADIGVAVELMYDLERFARNTGHENVAQEIELACQRIKFILGVDQQQG